MSRRWRRSSSRLRRSRRQARQSRRLLAIGRGGHARRARRQDRHRAGGVERCITRGRHRLHDGADASRRDAPRRADAGRARHAHDLQPARAALQSCRRQAPAHRRLLAPPGSSRWPRCCAISAPSASGSPMAATGSTRSPRPGRPRSSSSRDGAIRAFEMTPEEAGLARAEPAALKGGDAAHNAAALARVLDGAAERLSRHRAYERRRGARRRGQGRLRSGTAWRSATRRSGPARRGARSTD